jgi:hypothetical protein
MDESRVEFLRRLIASPSPSGFEQPAHNGPLLGVIGSKAAHLKDSISMDFRLTRNHYCSKVYCLRVL